MEAVLMEAGRQVTGRHLVKRAGSQIARTDASYGGRADGDSTRMRCGTLLRYFGDTFESVPKTSDLDSVWGASWRVFGRRRVSPGSKMIPMGSLGGPPFETLWGHF